MTNREEVLATNDASPLSADRRFRPDVQGLRAIAIVLVVLFHIGFPGFRGGYVGVDVFFVISGFVITGVLLRERSSTNATPLLAFYGRRIRRILPAATLVIIATVIGAAVFLGPVAAGLTATDGQWTAVFLANFHFAATSTNYLASQLPPSPLQNFWSLGVEEQFYVVYPTLFLLVASIFSRWSLRRRLAVALALCIGASFITSIVMTQTDPSTAFFSPFTRAWELALGALVAVAANQLRRLPSRTAAAASWIGLAAIFVAATAFTSSTSYPGWLVAVPVMGAALVIAGGTAQPTGGVETVLGVKPFQLIGLISYSWYLWHWPILIIATEAQGQTSLPLIQGVLWVLLALVLAMATYRFVENPVRHLQWLVKRRVATLMLGACLVLTGLVVSTYVVHRENHYSADTVDISGAQAGRCVLPSHTVVQSLRSEYDSQHDIVSSSGQRDPYRMLIVGDSTGCSLVPGLAAVGSQRGITVADASVLSCGVVSGLLAPAYVYGVNLSKYSAQCQAKADATEDRAVRKDRPNIVVWASTIERNSIEATTPAGKEALVSGTPQWRTVMAQRIKKRVQEFVSDGAFVVLLLEPPSVGGGSASDTAYEQLIAVERAVTHTFASHVAAIDLGPQVCPNGPPCPSLVHGMSLRPDGHHYSLNSSLWVASWLIPRIMADATAGTPVSPAS